MRDEGFGLGDLEFRNLRIRLSGFGSLGIRLRVDGAIPWTPGTDPGLGSGGWEIGAEEVRAERRGVRFWGFRVRFELWLEPFFRFKSSP